jgi:hypothetical protein
MAKLSEIKNLRYYPLFAILLVIIAITLSRVTMVATERTLLPRIYSTTQPTTMPLRVTNNDGSLSNGDKLRGWPKTTFFVVSGVAWMIACVVTTVVLVRVWPARSGT